VWAAQQILEAFAPVSAPGLDRLDFGLMRHTVMNGFFLALATRRPWNVEPAWFVGVKSQGWTRMVQAYHELPGLLTETDRSLAHRAGVGALIAIISRLRDIKTKVTNLYPITDIHASAETASMDALGMEAEEHVVMADSTTFPELYVPMIANGAAQAMKLVYTTLLSLIIECTILRIWYFRPETLALWHSTALPEAEETAYRLARELCKLSLSWTQQDKVR